MDNEDFGIDNPRFQRYIPSCYGRYQKYIPSVYLVKKNEIPDEDTASSDDNLQFIEDITYDFLNQVAQL